MNHLQNEVLSLFEDQLKCWNLAKTNYDAIKGVQKRFFVFDAITVEAQFNPHRKKSTFACKSARVPDENGCFLCRENRPLEQIGLLWHSEFLILCNPYPIFSKHFTIASVNHVRQSIRSNIENFLLLAKDLPDFVVFYNGPDCGASAPEHLHFQAGIRSEFPLYKSWNQIMEANGVTESDDLVAQEVNNGLRTFFLIEGRRIEDVREKLAELLQGEKEPDVNLLTWYRNETWVVCVFNRVRHRPVQFYKEGKEQLLVSPASVEMGGLIITPREEDFEKITGDLIIDIFKQV